MKWYQKCYLSKETEFFYFAAEFWAGKVLKRVGDTALLSRFLTVPWVNSVEGLARCCAPAPLKGQCHEMDIFFESLNILISAFCVCTDGFQGLSKAFHCPIMLLIFYLLLRNYLPNTRLSEYSSLCRETLTKYYVHEFHFQAKDVKVCGCVSSGSERRRWWRSRPGPAGGTSSGTGGRALLKKNLGILERDPLRINPHLFIKEKRAFPNLCDFALNLIRSS
jgi:hypothetical protein